MAAAPPGTVWQNRAVPLPASHPLGSEASPHAGTTAVSFALSMRYTVAGDGWSLSTMRAGRLSARSTPGSPISTTVPIPPPAPPSPRPSIAAARLSAAASVTLIAPACGIPPLVTFVPGSNVTEAAAVSTVRALGGSMPVGTEIAALPLGPAVDTTDATKLSGVITTACEPGGAVTAAPARSLLFTAWSSAPANRLPRGSGGSEASGAMST